MRPHSASAGLNLRLAGMQSWGRDKKSLLDTQACRTWDTTTETTTTTSLGGIGRQDRGRSFSSPKDLPEASSSTSDDSHSPSPWQIAALEEGMGVESKLRQEHHSQLRAEVSELKEFVGNLVSLISFNQVQPNNLELRTCEHVWKRACIDKLLTTKGAKQEDPREACSTNACKQDKQQQLEQQEEAAKTTLGIGTSIRTGQLEQKKLEQRDNKTTTNNNSMQQQQLRPDSLGTEAKGSPKRPWRILVDTGAELSVAPRSFAAEIPLSSLQPSDLKLHTASGKDIEIFGMKSLQLVCHGFCFVMSFVIANVSQPLLGLGSLLRNNISLHLDNQLGHYLGNNLGGKIQLEQLGLQIYLSACPVELGLSHLMRGNLLQQSLLPEAKKQAQELSQDEGGANPSFPLAKPKQHRQPRNKTAIGQQQAFTKEPHKQQEEKKQKGQRAVDKLKMQHLRFTEKVQLDLLSPEHPKHSLDEAMAQDLSLRILVATSLMKRWQLSTARLGTAWPPEQATIQLRQLGLQQSLVDQSIFVGHELCIMIQGESLIIGGEKTEQECFLHKLSAKIPLKDTNKLGDKNPLIFQDRSLELSQAEKSISLSLTSAFIQQLLCRHNLQDAKATSLPQEELGQEAFSCNINLDAHRTKLYRETVGALVWASMSRPDISFWAQTLAKSFAKPTESNERQLVKVLLYLKGTRHFSISLQPPRKWERAKSLELIAFSAAAWPEVGRSIMNVSLFLMGVPLAASTTTQATTPKATQLASVRLACRMAFHTKLLLQQLRVVKPLSLRVLLGGPLAEQLGLTRKARHLELHSWFGQFQLSKVGPQSNLAESLTYKLGTSGLHRLLPKLRMHARTAEELALHTELGLGEVASFESSSGSFFIGSLTQTPAMEQLCASQLCSEQLLDEQLLGKELGMPIDLPELQSTSSNESFHRISLQQDQLVAAYSQNSLHSQSLETEELATASSEKACTVRA